MSQYSIKDVKILSRKRSFQGYFAVDEILLKHRLFEGGWSSEVKRELFERGSAAAVILYDPKLEEVVLIKQFRVGALASKRSPWMYEIVAGIIEEGETADHVVQRESVEEAGLPLDGLYFIQDCFPSPGGCSECVSLYAGKVDASKAGGIHGLDEENEDILAERVSLETLKGYLDKGMIENLPCLAACQWLLLNRDKLHKLWS